MGDLYGECFMFNSRMVKVLAYIGVIKALEEEKLIFNIVGETSFG